MFRDRDGTIRLILEREGLLRESDFSPALLYWLAVLLFGSLVSRGLRMKRSWKGSGEPVSELAPALQGQAA